jgi:pimeloyl-ACP methyl ester carboxylesterase
MRARSTQELRLPFEGELLAAERRLFEETIVFVHHFGGNKKSTHRHARLVNELGFDAVVFNLLYHDATEQPNKMLLRQLPISADLEFGARHLWQEQIEAVLNAVPGRKIVFSFSMPTNSAVLAIAKRQAEDIAALVCDGGPFLQLPRCLWNLYTHQFNIESRFLRGAFTAASLALYGLGFERQLDAAAELLPPGFPALSFRAQADTLVPSEAIEEFFEETPAIRVDRVIIDEAKHLEGLKMNGMKYRQSLAPFLARVATRIG